MLVAASVTAVAAWYFFGGSFPLKQPPSEGNEGSAHTRAHFYRSPDVAIGNVAVKFFYAVPRNKAANIHPQWKQTLAEAVEKLSAFHALQFRGTSVLRFEIFPRPVILERDNLFYDTASTDFGNPHALIAIGEEIERRVFNEGGDLHSEVFQDLGTGETYPVMGIVYEGVGASGGVIWESELGSVEAVAESLQIPREMIFKVGIETFDGFFLLNRQFLTDAPYRLYGATLLYHEFAHTLGIPDQYDALSRNDEALSDDIMGARRREPIEANYLSATLLSDLGVFE